MENNGNGLDTSAEMTRGMSSVIRPLAGAVIGNALAFYDFLVYSFFAIQIGQAFFPTQNPSSSLLLSLAAFGVGFFTRPLGAVVIGRMADRVGRRPAMLLTFTLMGIGVVGMALTPPYRTIGVAAPVIVVAFRMLQGFALGGEIGSSTAFLVEIAPPQRRGLFSSFQYMTQDLSRFLASLVGLSLTGLLTQSAFDEWGWRLALLLGGAVLPLGFALRRSLPETLVRNDPERPLHAHMSPRKVAALGFVILASASVAGYAQLHLTTYAEATLRFSARVAFTASMINGLCTMCFDPVGGWLSDRFGRRPVIIAGTALLMLVTVPAFLIVVESRHAGALYGACAALGVLTGISQPPAVTAITEALPRNIRAGTLAITYSLAISLFGGTTQFAIAWLVAVTGNSLAPAWYMSLAAMLGLVAVLAMRETAPGKKPHAQA